MSERAIDMLEMCVCAHSRLLHAGRNREWACEAFDCSPCQKFDPAPSIPTRERQHRMSAYIGGVVIVDTDEMRAELQRLKTDAKTLEAAIVRIERERVGIADTETPR